VSAPRLGRASRARAVRVVTAQRRTSAGSLSRTCCASMTAFHSETPASGVTRPHSPRKHRTSLRLSGNAGTRAVYVERFRHALAAQALFPVHDGDPGSGGGGLRGGGQLNRASRLQCTTNVNASFAFRTIRKCRGSRTREASPQPRVTFCTESDGRTKTVRHSPAWRLRPIRRVRQRSVPNR